MLIAGLVLAGLAAALHIYIFWMESIAWDGPAARKTFGTSDADLEPTRALAFNQGFYNLFLALAVFLGIVVTAMGVRSVGVALILTGAGSMLAAALVLFVSSPDKRGAAIKQGFLPLLAVVATVIGLFV